MGLKWRRCMTAPATLLASIKAARFMPTPPAAGSLWPMHDFAAVSCSGTPLLCSTERAAPSSMGSPRAVPAASKVSCNGWKHRKSRWPAGTDWKQKQHGKLLTRAMQFQCRHARRLHVRSLQRSTYDRLLAWAVGCRQAAAASILVHVCGPQQNLSSVQCVGSGQQRCCASLRAHIAIGTGI